MKKQFSVRAGFTLIELLVVIAIIGIMATIGLTSFTNAQQRGRDAKRRGDMTDVQKSFEQYYASSGSTYLANCGAAMYASLPGGTAPTDPKSGWTAYRCTSTALTYCDCALLEATGTGNSTSNACAWGTGAGADYFCVRNLQ